MTSHSNVTAQRVYEVLCAHARGRSNAVHAATLAGLLGIEFSGSSARGNGAGRDVRKVVSEAVCRGFPICSSTKGYWVPESSAECLISASEIESRGRTLIERGSMLRSHAEKLQAGHVAP